MFCAKGLPQWLWIVDSLGFVPVWCLLSQTSDVEWLRPVYPKIVFTTDVQYCRPVAVVFCGDRPLGIATLWTELQLMFFLKQGARPARDWS
jgi:hypothetical protein